MEQAAIFVLGSILLGKAILVFALTAFCCVVLYFLGWRWAYPQVQDPVMHWLPRLTLVLVSLAVILINVGLMFELALQVRDFFDAVFN